MRFSQATVPFFAGLASAAPLEKKAGVDDGTMTLTSLRCLVETIAKFSSINSNYS